MKGHIEFISSSRAREFLLMKALKYPVLPYPKAENKNYTLGDFQAPVLVETKLS